MHIFLTVIYLSGMSLDFYLEAVRPTNVFSGSCTHNLGSMARDAGVYDCLWQPTENGFDVAEKIIPVLEAGIALLKAEPERFKRLNPDNGWGDYDGFVAFCELVLANCREYPDAKVSTWI